VSETAKTGSLERDRKIFLATFYGIYVGGLEKLIKKAIDNDI